MTFAITSLYGAFAAILAIILSNIVSAHRGRTGTSLLYGTDGHLARAIRQHGNFTETAALTLLLMAFAEARGMPALYLHGLGILFIIARLAHPFGLDSEKPIHPMRLLGTLGTQAVLAICAGYIVVTAF